MSVLLLCSVSLLCSCVSDSPATSSHFDSSDGPTLTAAQFERGTAPSGSYAELNQMHERVKQDAIKAGDTYTESTYRHNGKEYRYVMREVPSKQKAPIQSRFMPVSFARAHYVGASSPPGAYVRRATTTYHNPGFFRVDLL